MPLITMRELHRMHRMCQNLFPRTHIATFAPAKARNIHVLFLQAKSFSLWHLCHKRKKSADSLRSLYFFGHDIGRQCLSSQWENSIECIECARICFQEPILRHLLLLKLETYMFSSCKPKAFHSGTCVINERNQQTAWGASTSLDMTSGANASHHNERTP